MSNFFGNFWLCQKCIFEEAYESNEIWHNFLKCIFRVWSLDFLMSKSCFFVTWKKFEDFFGNKISKLNFNLFEINKYSLSKKLHLGLCQ